MVIPALPADEVGTVIALLGDRPETAAAIHVLRRGIGRAWGLRDTEGGWRALAIRGDQFPREPFAYGEPAAILELLRQVPGWTCINVAEESAQTLADLLEADTGRRPRLLGDRYFVLDGAVEVFRHPDVRRLAPEDTALVACAAPEVRGGGFKTTAEMLRDGIAAGAVVNGALVAIAHVAVITDRYEEVGVATIEGHRGRGYAAACASLVVEAVLARGRTAVWSAGETNDASLRTARKLGFRPYVRRCYVIVDP